MKQYIVVRKDLPMSAGKMSAQVSHASIAFLTHMLSRHVICQEENGEKRYSIEDMAIDTDLWELWMSPESSFAKVVLGVKNKNQLNKVVDKAIAAGLKENVDYFCIRDEGRTELDDYRDEDGTIFTCIGFRPCKDGEFKEIVGKLQLFH